MKPVIATPAPRQIMGPTASAYSTAYVKMSKFQMAQVWGCTQGLFMRRVRAAVRQPWPGLCP